MTPLTSSTTPTFDFKPNTRESRAVLVADMDGMPCELRHKIQKAMNSPGHELHMFKFAKLKGSQLLVHTDIRSRSSATSRRMHLEKLVDQLTKLIAETLKKPTPQARSQKRETLARKGPNRKRKPTYQRPKQPLLSTS